MLLVRTPGRQAQISSARRHLAVMLNRLAIASSSISNCVEARVIVNRTVPAGQLGNARRQLNHCLWVFRHGSRQRQSRFGSNLLVNVLGRRVSSFVCLCNFDNCTDNSFGAVFTYYRTRRRRLSHSTSFAASFVSLCASESGARRWRNISWKRKREKRSKSTFAFHHSARDSAELPIAALDSRQLRSYIAWPFWFSGSWPKCSLDNRISPIAIRKLASFTTQASARHFFLVT